MLELFGSGYVIDHCIAAFQKERKDELYREYITDALKLAYQLNVRYADLIKPAETRSPEEIIDHIKDGLSKLGGGYE